MLQHIGNDWGLRPAVQVELRLFGSFELVDDTGKPIAITARKMRALLAYLAAAPRSTDTRQRLAGLLWASARENQARQSLRQLLSSFRRDAAPAAASAVIFDETIVRLDLTMIAVDRAAVMELPPDAGLDALARAADLYRDDFAPGLEIGEAEFDAWLQAERVRCREAAVALFDRLVRKLVELGRHDEALRRANRLAEIDPLREETHRLVIAAEAVVSGRASAMQRFENFRTLLRDEIGVRPEPTTLELLEELRRQKQPNGVSDAVPEPVDTAAEAALLPASTAPRRHAWQRPWLAAGLVAVLPLAGLAADAAWRPIAPPAASDRVLADRASVVLLPFDYDENLDALRREAGPYQAEVRGALSRGHYLTLVDVPGTMQATDPIGVGRNLHALYVVRTRVTQTVGGAAADVSLLNTTTGANIFTATVPMTADKSAFAQAVRRFVFPEIAINRAEVLAADHPGSSQALLWRAAAAEATIGVATDAPEIALFEAVLRRDPNQRDALLGLARRLMLRAARDQSKDVKRIEDLRRAQAYLDRLKAQSPELTQITYLEGMLAKVQDKFVEAANYFAVVLRRDPSNATVIAEAAHTMMFLGQFEDAYRQMESINADAIGESFIAGETALVTGHPNRAAAYFDHAVSRYPDISRNHAWRSVALWRLGRKAEAHQAAVKSQTVPPPYLPNWMAERSRLADQRYQDARDRCVEDFKQALAYEAPTQTN